MTLLPPTRRERTVGWRLGGRGASRSNRPDQNPGGMRLPALQAPMTGLVQERTREKVSLNGLGTPVGHPRGATGTMRMATLIHEIKKRGMTHELGTICGGGGQGICIIVER